MPNNRDYTIRTAKPDEFKRIGHLMIQVYSQLKGFPNKSEQPDYYKMLANIGDQTKHPAVEILVAISPDNKLDGSVVYFDDMALYGSGGSATEEKNSAGFRLLAVEPRARGKGVAKLLTLKCIEKAQQQGRDQVIIHTTNAMKIAWSMYEKMGFVRSEDLDFQQGNLPVFGFRLPLN